MGLSSSLYLDIISGFYYQTVYYYACYVYTKYMTSSLTSQLLKIYCVIFAVIIGLLYSQPTQALRNCNYAGTADKVTNYYTGPLIDTHLHIPSPLDSDNGNPVLWQDMSISDIACTLKREGTQSVFAFFPVYAGSQPYDQFYKAADRAQAKYPDLFVRFINPPGKQSGIPTVTVNRLRTFLNDRPGLFQGYGEIGLYGLDSDLKIASSFLVRPKRFV